MPFLVFFGLLRILVESINSMICLIIVILVRDFSKFMVFVSCLVLVFGTASFCLNHLVPSSSARVFSVLFGVVGSIHMYYLLL